MVKCKDCRFGGLKVLLDNESAPCLRLDDEECPNYNEETEIKEFVGESLIYDIIDTAWEVGKGRPHVIIKIKTLEGEMLASDGDYIIKGLRGEFYPCKPDVFHKKYELIE